MATRVRYDGAGRATAVRDRLGNEETYAFGPTGNLESLADGGGNRTTFGSGPQGITGVGYADGTWEHWEYDAAGFVHRIDVGGEAYVEIERDAAGRPIRTAFAGGEVLNTRYGPGGKLVSTAVAGEAESAVAFEYDGEDRVVAERQGAHSISYDYDRKGALAGIRYPSGDQVGFSYDLDMRIEQITDWNGGIYRLHYSADHRGFRLELPNGLTTHLVTTGAGLPESMLVSREAAREPQFSFRYRYDAEDRIGSFEDSSFGRKEYAYDNANRLVDVTAGLPSENEELAYDRAGNRTRRNGRVAEYNALNQLIRDGDALFRYDRRGNMVSREGSAGWSRYRYNGRNYLVAAETSAGKRVSFGYDALGRRIRKSSGSASMRYSWAGEQLIGEVVSTASGRTAVDYLYLPGTYIPIAARVDGKVYYIHADHLGTPRRITDSRGEVVWSADFGVFGEARIEVESLRNHLRFPGQYFDEETGLHYNRFRYYAADLGRYITRDPQGYAGGLNLYVYAANNPVNQTDPLGLWTLDGVLKGVAKGCAIVGGVAAGAAVTLALGGSPIGILAGAALAGFIIGGLNEYIDTGEFCLTCALKGAATSVAAALPFVFAAALTAGMGLAAAVGVFMLLGAIGGGLAYAVDFLLTPGAKWNSDKFWESVIVGALLAGALRAAAKPLAALLAKAGITEELPPWLRKIMPEIGGRAAERGRAGLQESRGQGCRRQSCCGKGRCRKGRCGKKIGRAHV